MSIPFKKFLVAAEGVEPSVTGSEPVVLTSSLSGSLIVAVGFEPTVTVSKTDAFTHLATPHYGLRRWDLNPRLSGYEPDYLTTDLPRSL